MVWKHSGMGMRRRFFILAMGVGATLCIAACGTDESPDDVTPPEDLVLYQDPHGTPAPLCIDVLIDETPHTICCDGEMEENCSETTSAETTQRRQFQKLD